MCEPAPAELVGGMPTMRVMPAKTADPPDTWWQATQLLLMPRWFISDPAKRAPSITGVDSTDEFGPT